ncbi:MAG: glycerophosphodiester phosphodiesterase [Eubacteriales bacterium]|nr:glycerophosphodiester phosphodiesterase [Eubacteriales bacterium]
MKGDYATMITAHAGAEQTQPNTVESFRKLVTLGVDAIETDVRLSGGVLWLSHNELEPVKHYDTLEELFAIVQPREGLLVNIDLKEEGLVPAVTELAERCGMAGRFLFTGSVGASDADFIHAHHLTAWYNEFLFTPEEAKDAFASLAQKGFDVLNTHWGLASQSRVEQYGPEHFSVWTVDSEEQLTDFLRRGVRNITTRIPCTALRLRGEIQR